jgi:broad specificity phosphatase PhoE
MTHFLYLVRHGEAAPHDGPLSPAGPGDGDNHALIVTHKPPHRLAGQPGAVRPSWRWLGLNQMNCALTVIAYRPGLPPALISFNDAGHLTPELRWTGIPAAARPASG